LIRTLLQDNKNKSPLRRGLTTISEKEMKVKLTKDYQYYVPREDGKGNRLRKTKKDKVVDLPEARAKRWIEKKVAVKA
jgi:hypothetical protein